MYLLTSMGISSYIAAVMQRVIQELLTSPLGVVSFMEPATSSVMLGVVGDETGFTFSPTQGSKMLLFSLL